VAAAGTGTGTAANAADPELIPVTGVFIPVTGVDNLEDAAYVQAQLSNLGLGSLALALLLHGVSLRKRED
jgi:hypothetical protein